MSERAKIFEALMRHLWSYWLRMPATTDNFYFGHRPDARAHVVHAQELLRELAYEEVRQQEKELLLGPELPPSAA